MLVFLNKPQRIIEQIPESGENLKQSSVEPELQAEAKMNPEQISQSKQQSEQERVADVVSVGETKTRKRKTLKDKTPKITSSKPLTDLNIDDFTVERVKEFVILKENKG